MVNFKALTAAIVLSFSVSALATPLAREPLLSATVSKTSAKNITATVAKDQARLARFNTAASGSAPVTNQLDSYVAAVKVGSQTFSLIVDTGSSNTWVGANGGLHGGSSTGKSISVSYGSVLLQSVGVASTSTGFTGVDGIVGFGPVDLTLGTVSGSLTVPTFLDNLKSQGTISSEVLGVYFKPESGSDTDDANGELTFGGTDSSKYAGSITYTPTLTSGDASAYWGIAVSSISYGGTSLGSGSAIVDTGTTLIYIPSLAYDAFLLLGGGSTDIFSGLAKFSSQPTATFAFTIGGKTFSLSPSQYLIPTAQYSNFGLSGSAYYSWIGNGGSSSVDFIIGQKFLENYYSVFDTS
ncbi:hypothetical protein HWV62_7543 [Athelia sp. TMB]|nr:hypothetical protein HWV62_7543 [Athelia sp. TMB]